MTKPVRFELVLYEILNERHPLAPTGLLELTRLGRWPGVVPSRCARFMGDFENNKCSDAQVMDWLAQAFNEPREKITPETRREDIASWDSLGVLVLMADLDEKFDLVLTDQDMRAMTKIGDVLAVLRERGKLKP